MQIGVSLTWELSVSVCVSLWGAGADDLSRLHPSASHTMSGGIGSSFPKDKWDRYGWMVGWTFNWTWHYLYKYLMKLEQSRLTHDQHHSCNSTFCPWLEFLCILNQDHFDMSEHSDCVTSWGLCVFLLSSSTSSSGVLHGAGWAASGRRGSCWSQPLSCWVWFRMSFTAWWPSSPALRRPAPLKWQRPLLACWRRSCSSSEYWNFRLRAY